MSNETKRDVFEMALDDWKQNFIISLPRDGSFEDWSETLSDYTTRYDAAFPDDLPVIPEDVSEWLTWCKRSNYSLKDALDCEMRVSEEDFARAWVLGAWVLGVWHVEETGEIVKLEEEK